MMLTVDDEGSSVAQETVGAPGHCRVQPSGHPIPGLRGVARRLSRCPRHGFLGSAGRREDQGFHHSIRSWLFELIGLSAQQLPIPVLFVPDHQDADPHGIDLAVTFGLAA